MESHHIHVDKEALKRTSDLLGVRQLSSAEKQQHFSDFKQDSLPERFFFSHMAAGTVDNLIDHHQELSAFSLWLMLISQCTQIYILLSVITDRAG